MKSPRRSEGMGVYQAKGFRTMRSCRHSPG